MIQKKTHLLISSLLIILLIMVSLCAPVFAAGAMDMISLGGNSGSDPLRMDVYDNGDLGLYFAQPGYVNQYYGGTAWGSNIFFDRRSESLHYVTNYYGSYGTDVGNGTLSKNGNSVTGIWQLDSGDITFQQIITYVPGSYMVTKVFRLINNSSDSYSNLKFIHGGDTYFGGADSARSYWNDGLEMIYVRNNDMTQFGLMGFYGTGSTPADQYFGGNYWTGYQFATAGNLPNTADSSFVDAGYQLQWNRATLAAGETWEIRSAEMITEPNALQVIAPAGQEADPGDTVEYEFIIQNFSSDEKTYLLDTDSENGWSTNIIGGSSITLSGNGGYSNVEVEITVPADVTGGSTDKLTLTATDSSDSNVSNSNSTTTTVKSDEMNMPIIRGRLEVVSLTENPTDGSGILTKYLNYHLAMPEIWLTGVKNITVWLESEIFDLTTAQQKAKLPVGLSLLKDYNIRLMMKTVYEDGSIEIKEVDNADIKKNIPVLIPVDEFAGISDLGIVYMDTQGHTAILPVTPMTINGKNYLQFENNHFSEYGVVSGTVRNPAQQQQYIIQPGDTLASIAAKFGVTVQSLANANNISNLDLIYAGKVLIIA